MIGLGLGLNVRSARLGGSGVLAPILDRLSVAATAIYALRKLRAAYTGFCVRVRRSSDNTERNIGFVNNVIDVTDLLAFVGGGNGFVVTKYDQSGNGFDATQSNAAFQPRIVSAGVLDIENTKPTLTYIDTAPSFLQTPDIPNNSIFGINLSVNYVSRLTRVLSNSAFSSPVGARAGGGSWWEFQRDNTGVEMGFHGAGQYWSGFKIPSALGAKTSIISSAGTVLNQWHNGTNYDVNRAISAFSSNLNAPIRIGAGSAGSPDEAFGGSMPEVILFTSALSNADRQLLQADQNEYYNILILDRLSASAVTIYSLRRMRGAYTGFCIRVRRSSDNTEQNIGFVNNVIDTVALLAFVGAGDGFVVTKYDQSVNGFNATQATAANQPRIVSGGVLNIVNSRSSLSFDGTNHFMLVNSTFTAQSVIIVLNALDAGGVFKDFNGIFASSGGTGNTWIANGGATTVRALTQSSVFGTARTNGANDSTTACQFAPLANLKVLSSVGTTGLSDTAWHLGQDRANPARRWQGNISELVAFSSELSTADRQLLERDQGTYYGITVA